MMTVPLLTQVVADTAKNQPGPNARAGNLATAENATDTDFATLVENQVAQGSNKRLAPSVHASGDASLEKPTANSGDTADPGDALLGVDGEQAEEVGLVPAGAETRKKVTIPELPAQAQGTEKSPLKTEAASQDILGTVDATTVTPDKARHGTDTRVGEFAPLANAPTNRGTAEKSARAIDVGTNTLKPENGRTDGTKTATIAATVAEQSAQTIPASAPLRPVSTGGATPAGSLTPASVATQAGGATLAAVAPPTATQTPQHTLEPGYTDLPTQQNNGADPLTKPPEMASKIAQVAVAPQQAVNAKNRDIVEDRAKIQDAREVSARRYDAAPAMPAPAVQTPPPTAMAPQMAMLQPMVQQAVADKQSQSLHSDAELEAMHFDLRGSSASNTQQTAMAPTALARADLPRSIAAQISDIVRTKPDKPVDVSLNPDELGRVRLSVSTGEGGVVLSILAERPETLELMRRHADVLARELSQLGFGSVDIAFGEGGDAAQNQGDQPDKEGAGSSGLNLTMADEVTRTTPTAQPQPTYSTGGLDIRV